MGTNLAVARALGENLRRARRAAGLSQEEVGIGASLHRTEIGLLERGERLPRVDTLLKLAGAMGVRVESSLFDGLSWKPAEATPGQFQLKPQQGQVPGQADESQASERVQRPKQSRGHGQRGQ